MAYRILITDDVDADGVALLAAEPDLVVDEVPTLPRDELLARIGGTTHSSVVVRRASRPSCSALHRDWPSWDGLV